MYCGDGKVVGAVAVSVGLTDKRYLFVARTADWSHDPPKVTERYHTAHRMLRTVFASLVPDLKRLLLPHHRSHRPLRGSGDFSCSLAYYWLSSEIQRSWGCRPWRLTGSHGPRLLQRLCKSPSPREYRLRGRCQPAVTEANTVYWFWQRPVGRDTGSSKIKMVKFDVKVKEEVELAALRATMDRGFPTR